jgi:hypothetical protein
MLGQKQAFELDGHTIHPVNAPPGLYSCTFKTVDLGVFTKMVLIR